MPPRMRRPEAPDQRDARIQKYLNQAREYWRMAPAYLVEDDFRQACEKGWSTVTQLTKAFATLRGWEHDDHDAIRDAVRDLGREMPTRAQAVAVIRSLRAAESLYGKFYEVSMNAFLAQSALDDVRPLLEILWQQQPSEYTADLSFAAFCQLEPEPEPPQPTGAGNAATHRMTIMPMPNFANRTLYHGDNLDFLRGMNSGTVQLIATDPPFNKNRDFHATPDSLAAGAGFQDRWRWDDVIHPEWLDQIKDDWPDIQLTIEASKVSYGPDMAAFLVFMAVRLAEMRRILTDDGSIYLQCDSTAGHYLKTLMDAIFGTDNFRSEIVWRRANAKGLAFKSYPHNHDVILFYSKSDKFTWHRPYRPHDPEYVRKFYRYVEPETGRHYTLSDLTNPNKDRPNLTYEWNGQTRVWRWTRERMQEAHNSGLIHYSSTGLARQKRYLDEMKGYPVDTIWEDIPPLPANARERTGYPTQKPLKLYERIIAASSNPGDWVLDPFCGCATTPVAAEMLGRQWVGIDIWDKAYQTVLERLGKIGFDVGDSGHLPSGRAVLYASAPPARSDDNETALPYLKTRLRFPEPPGPKLSRDQMFAILVEQNGVVCRGCDRRFDDPLYLELDHNTPRSDGGLNHISNRVLLCGPCNRIKSNTLTLSGLRRENGRRGRMSAGAPAGTGAG